MLPLVSIVFPDLLRKLRIIHVRMSPSPVAKDTRINKY